MLRGRNPKDNPKVLLCSAKSCLLWMGSAHLQNFSWGFVLAQRRLQELPPGCFTVQGERTARSLQKETGAETFPQGWHLGSTTNTTKTFRDLLCLTSCPGQGYGHPPVVGQGEQGCGSHLDSSFEGDLPQQGDLLEAVHFSCLVSILTAESTAQLQLPRHSLLKDIPLLCLKSLHSSALS